MKRRTSFTYRIILFAILALGLVTVTGIFTYKRLTQIVTDISGQNRVDLKLVTSKKLLNNLNEAELSVKSFGLTKDTTYLQNFNDAVDESRKEINELRKINKRVNTSSFDIDSLDTLVSQKFKVLHKLLIIQDEFRVQKALNKVVDKVSDAAHENKKESEEEEKKKDNFFQRIFNNREKNKEKESKDTILTLNQVNKEVETVKEEERSIEEQLKVKELKLIKADQALNKKIYRILDNLESAELKRMKINARKAERSVEITNNQIILFCLSISLLLLIMAYNIRKYVQNNKRYRKALRKAKLKAEDLANTKEQFLANMSHEIRTPMNAIAGFSEQIAQSQLTGDQKEQLDMIQRSTDHLIHLINDVLDFTKLENGKLKLEQTGFKPREVIRDVVSFIAPLAKESSLDFSSDISEEVPEIVIGDPVRMRQILLNLASNAVKFTQEGKVTIKASSILRNEENATLKLDVIDTGIGMNEEQIEKVFQDFEQASSSTSRIYGGTGLGLSITKMLVELHEGSIRIESKPEKGTTVFVEIPYETGSPDDIKQEECIDQSISLEGVSILIVDDQEYNRKLLTTILKKYKATITEVEDGNFAVDEMKNNSYDLILMDIRMPKMDGVEATRNIRMLTDPEKNNVPIIALTAAVNPGDRKKYTEAGMNGFLPKPFRERELIKKVTTILNENTDIKLNTTMSLRNQSNSNNGSLNFEELKSISDGDKEFYIDMLQTFIESTREGIDNMEESLLNEEWKMLAEYAHKICAPCRHLSARKLHDDLKEIERRGRNKTELHDIDQLVEETIEEAERIIDKVSDELEKEKKNH